MARRWLRLPARGTALVSTDLHGNGEDFRTLREVFLARRQIDPETYWVLLGDAVHAPDESARRRQPELYDFLDESAAIVRGVLELQAAHPGHVHYVLGNHDYGHVGGPHTHKFHPDEVEHLGSTLDEPGRQTLRELFAPALLAVVAPCGALLAHGSPDDSLERLDDLDRIDRFPPANHYLARVLDSFLMSYGQPGEVTARLLARLSEAGEPLCMVIHGHDRDEAGIFFEGDNQVCPVIFGAPRWQKRYLRLDLGSRYDGPRDLAEGREVIRLYP